MKVRTRTGPGLKPLRPSITGSVMRVWRETTPLGWCAIAAALVLCAWSASTVRPAEAIIVYGITLAALVTAAAIDVSEQRLPNILTIGTGALGLVALTVISLATGDGGPLRALSGGAIFGGWILLGALIVRDGYGLGDVKLAAVCGILAGWLSWTAVAVAILATQIVITLLLLHAKSSRHQSVALGPAFALGVLVAVWLA